MELLPELLALGLPAEAVDFCRLQSSHCETCDFQAVLRELDHNLLMRLAIGELCVVYDCGSRSMLWPKAAVVGTGAPRPSPDDKTVPEMERLFLPRALWWGLEWTRFALSELWQLPAPDGRREAWLRGIRVTSMFQKQVKLLPKPLRKRLKYYRSIAAAAGTEQLLLFGASRATELDGQKDVYCDMVLSSQRGQLQSSPEDCPTTLQAVEYDTTSTFAGALAVLVDGMPLPDGVELVEARTDWRERIRLCTERS